MNHDDGHNGGRGTGMNTARADSAARQSVIVVGGGIGGLAAALALTRQGVEVQLLEQASRIGEIGAGIKLGPNAFAALDALGVGRAARERAVFTDHIIMMDAVDAREVVRIDTGEDFRARFGGPYAVIHRADIHLSILEAVRQEPLIRFHTSTQIADVSQQGGRAEVVDTQGRRYQADAVIGADGVKSVIRQRMVGDPVRVTGHVVYRAVVERDNMPGTAHQRARALGRPALPPGPLSAARRPAIQPGRHLPQPRAGGMGRARRQQGRSAVVLPGHTPAPAPDAGPAHFVEALGHRRPRAGRALGPGTRHAAGRRRASHDPVHGARRLHGAGRRRDAGRGRARLRPRPGSRLPALRVGPHPAQRPRGLVHARDGPAVSRARRRTHRAQFAVDRPQPVPVQDALQWLYGWKVEQCLAGPIQP